MTAGVEGRRPLTVVKVGGAVVEEEAALSQLLNAFRQIPGAKVLVHGGGRSATQLARQLGIDSRMVGGRRITDADMLRIVTMVYGGLVNKHVVAALQALGVNAMGLTGADMDVMRAHRRPPVTQGDGTAVDYGYVGDVDACNGELLAGLIRRGVVPVMAPLTHDGQGSLLNTNADTVAAETAKALAGYFDVTLVYCFEKDGVLRNESDPHSVIPAIDEDTFRQLTAQGIVSGGMIPKIENALAACRAGVHEVIITRADRLADNTGTHIRGSKESIR